MEHLVDLASSSYGSYTASLRAFLNIYYDIRIDPPHELSQYSRHKNKSEWKKENDYFVSPNPSSGEFIIGNKSKSQEIIQVHIFSSSGKSIFTITTKTYEPIHVEDQLKEGIYFIKINNLDSKNRSQFKLMIL